MGDIKEIRENLKSIRRALERVEQQLLSLQQQREKGSKKEARPH